MPFGWNGTEFFVLSACLVSSAGAHFSHAFFSFSMHVNHILCYEYCCSCCCYFLPPTANILNWVRARERESHAEQLHCTRLPHKEYDYYSCTNLLIKCPSYIKTHTYKSLKRYGISSYFRFALLKIIMFVFWQRNVPIIAHKIDAHTNCTHIKIVSNRFNDSLEKHFTFFLCSFVHSLSTRMCWRIGWNVEYENLVQRSYSRV